MQHEGNQQFAPEQFSEEFPNAPLVEVSYEMRFAPKLRVMAEIWKLQENLTSIYPEFGTENTIVGNGLLTSHYFKTPDGENKVVASQSNFALILKRYPGFNHFLEEAVTRTEHFCSVFEIGQLLRVGLRYNNQFLLPRGDQLALKDFVNTFVDLNRIDLANTSQFILLLRCALQDHDMTIRTAFISDPTPSYVLDLDCYTERACSPSELRGLLTNFHNSAKKVFLQHITPTLKDEFRRRQR